MIVYGDPSERATLLDLATDLRRRLQALRLKPPGRTLDAARSLLIACGQVEQALADHPETASAAPVSTVLTDTAASLFVRLWVAQRGATTPPAVHTLLDSLSSNVDSLLSMAPRFEGSVLTVKNPEGFAFYTLYPEQYAEAAVEWMGSYSPDNKTVVVGIRSIGTTLSAVVLAALRAKGADAVRITVRPSGHPFAREVKIDGEDLGGADAALIVDEGPGLSGSSTAACAEALTLARIRRERIAFLPGHGGMPGGQASDAVRRWWTQSARHVVLLNAIRWEGRTLPETLKLRTAEILCVNAEDVEVEDLSAGLWRGPVYDREADYPPAALAFERTKYRCMARLEGTEVPLFWKFAGTNAADEQERMRTLAERGWTVAPVGETLGFVARPWINGVPLSRLDLHPDICAALGRYVADASGQPLSSREAEAALQRLCEMTVCNLREGVGDSAAERALIMTQQVNSQALSRIPSYGDGRMAPHEWIRTPEGCLHKTDCGGHNRDHTVIGRQPVLWDLAGAICEWDMSSEEAGFMLESFQQATGCMMNGGDLRFFQLAYAAFRIGLATMCGEAAPDSVERGRHKREAERFCEQARQLVGITQNVP